MKDALSEYKEYLLKNMRLPSAQTYTNRLELLLKDQSALKFDELPNVDKMIQSLSQIRYRIAFLQYKNVFLKFLEFKHITLSQEQLNQIEQLEKRTHKICRKKKRVNYKIVDKTIKHIRNQKLKLSYQTLLATGLRVSELSEIKRDDCIITNDFICLNFISKDRKDRTKRKERRVVILRTENQILYENLIELINNTEFSEKVFYSLNYLQNMSHEYNFYCHDLRAIYVEREYKKIKSKIESEEKKRSGKVSLEKMQHSKGNALDIYLKGNIQM